MDDCKDTEELAHQCPIWKKQGECTSKDSEKFMKKYCPKTCHKCSGKTIGQFSTLGQGAAKLQRMLNFGDGAIV